MPIPFKKSSKVTKPQRAKEARIFKRDDKRKEAMRKRREGEELNEEEKKILVPVDRCVAKRKEATRKRREGEELTAEDERILVVEDKCTAKAKEVRQKRREGEELNEEEKKILEPVDRHVAKRKDAMRKRREGDELIAEEKKILEPLDRHVAKRKDAMRKRREGKELTEEEKRILVVEDKCTDKLCAKRKEARQKRREGKELTEEEKRILVVEDKHVAKGKEARRKRREREELNEEEKKILVSVDRRIANEKEARRKRRKREPLTEEEKKILEPLDKRDAKVKEARRKRREREELNEEEKKILVSVDRRIANEKEARRKRRKREPLTEEDESKAGRPLSESGMLSVENVSSPFVDMEPPSEVVEPPSEVVEPPSEVVGPLSGAMDFSLVDMEPPSEVMEPLPETMELPYGVREESPTFEAEDVHRLVAGDGPEELCMERSVALSHFEDISKYRKSSAKVLTVDQFRERMRASGRKALVVDPKKSCEGLKKLKGLSNIVLLPTCVDAKGACADLSLIIASSRSEQEVYVIELPGKIMHWVTAVVYDAVQESEVMRQVGGLIQGTGNPDQVEEKEGDKFNVKTIEVLVETVAGAIEKLWVSIRVPVLHLGGADISGDVPMGYPKRWSSKDDPEPGYGGTGSTAAVAQQPDEGDGMFFMGDMGKYNETEDGITLEHSW